jgi:hypothetical protein
MPRLRKSTEVKYYYTSGLEFRIRATGEEYKGPYLQMKGVYYTGDRLDTKDPNYNMNLVDYTIPPEVLVFKSTLKDFDDLADYPEPYRPVFKAGLDEISRVYAYDPMYNRIFEIDPQKSKYYAKSKPLRKRYHIESINWQLKGLSSMYANLDSIVKLQYPTQLKDAYFNPSEYVSNAPDILTLIDLYPLFVNITAAEEFGKYMGIGSMTHTHIYKGQTGYMAAGTHADLSEYNFPESN